jgi:hypothetical protein
VASFDEARRAKAMVLDLLGDNEVVNGVGVTRLEDSYAVKVNLSREPDADLTIPGDVDGVPVMWEVVGRISSR